MVNGKKSLTVFANKLHLRCTTGFLIRFCSSQLLSRNRYKISKTQKRPPKVLCKKMCSQKFRKIKESYLLDKVHRETPVPKSLFNKVAGLRPATSLKKKFWHRCSALNFETFLRTPLLQNTSRRLLLETLDTRLSSART